MLNIVIPMAGRGSRFAQEGYTLPKPLIPVRGRPMIQVVIDNLRPSVKHRFIFLCLAEHIRDFQIDEKVKTMTTDPIIVPVRSVTEGAACTVLLAKEYIHSEEPLMIANSDQWVDLEIDDYLNAMAEQKKDGFIMTMWADDPKWSYLSLDDQNRITEVVEKKVVSNEATVGIYNYARGRDFVDAAEEMIRQNLRVNGEFYVAPAYNQLIDAGADIGYYNVGKEYDGMYGMGIPSDLAFFENSEISKKALKKQS